MRREISAPNGNGSSGAMSVTMHDGSVVHFRKVADDYDPTSRDAAIGYVRAAQRRGEVLTGLLYLDPSSTDMHAMNNTVAKPLVDLPFESLCPGSAALDELMEEFR
jgi:2-oxoglutarate ferredoxin oxidoreductase subunit beta